MIIATILITDAEFDDIRSNLNDVMDTMLQRPGIYKKDTEEVSRWGRDKSTTRVYTDIPLSILVVWGGEDKNTQTRNGSYDGTQGYVLVKYDAALAAGIVSVGQQFTGETPQDLIQFSGVTYEITGMNLLGQLKDTDCVVKFHISKGLTQN